MKSICVYLGANPGNSPKYSNCVTTLGQQIAQTQSQLIYGGSSLGLMGLLANTVIAHGGKVSGIITRQLVAKEQPLTILDELIITETMLERKRIMQQRSDAFIVMPGGLGTMEEAFETWNAIKIGILNKPIGFLNIDGYFDQLFSFISNCEKSGFISSSQMHIPQISDDPRKLMEKMLNFNLE